MLVHVLIVVAMPALVVVHAMFHQDMWGRMLCPEEGMDGKPPLLWADVTGARVTSLAADDSYSLWGEVYVVPFVSALLYEAGIFVGLSFLRLLTLYLSPTGWWRRSVKVVQHLYMVFFVFHLFLLFVYVGVIGAWLVLAAALEPDRFLPFGVAVLALVVVGTTVSKQMIAAADRFKDALKKAFSLVLQASTPRSDHARGGIADARAALAATCPLLTGVPSRGCCRTRCGRR